MTYDLNRGLLFGAVLAALFFFAPAVNAGTVPVDRKLYNDLIKFPSDKKIVEVDGVPCLKVYLKPGQSVSYFCRFVPYFDGNFNFYRQQIALINRLEPMAIIDGDDELSTNVKFIYVPLNFSVRPKILPDRISSISQYPQYMLIDVGQQCLGLYAYGRLIQQFPISSGKTGTPTRKFVIETKEHDHYSTKYENAWMPYSLRLFGNYFIHGGILPSYAASHGCVRMIYENAVYVYNWAKVGTPGEVINGTDSIAKDEAPKEDGPDIKVLY